MEIDYLETGADNRWRQGWVSASIYHHPNAFANRTQLQLSHGVEFVYKLTIADSYDAKHRMLDATSGVSESEISLPEALWDVIDDDKTDDRRLGEYSDSELHSLAKRHGDETEEDTDRGPYEAWREANSERWPADACMLSDSAWLRERGYVFWDGDRLRKQQCGFGDDPGDRRDYTEAEYEEMMESFRERSKIWQKGGKGYWSRTDTSRVVWP